MRKQGETEPVDNFITDLYTLAKHCGYNALHDKMIRDRIVVGIRDSRSLKKSRPYPRESRVSSSTKRVGENTTAHCKRSSATRNCH